MNNDLDTSERHLIAQALSVRPEAIANQNFVISSYNVDDTIVAEGAPDDAAYVILSGALRTVKLDAHQSLVTLARHERGALVGEWACFQSTYRRDVRILQRFPAVLNRDSNTHLSQQK